MFAADVLQLLQVVLLGQIAAKAFHGFIIPLLSAETALSVVPGQIVNWLTRAK